MKRLVLFGGIFLLLSGLLGLDAAAQTSKRKKNAKPAAPAPSPTVQTTPQASPIKVPAKRNGRPGDGPANGTAVQAVSTPNYFYEFTRPGFVYSPVLIEHDESGNGKITFNKDGSAETITDPVALTTVTLARINEYLQDLDFLASTATYQTDLDHSNMGNMTFTYKKDGRERTVKYNWTNNKSAKALLDEYRNISNEYTWRFEISVARENQPLLAPGLLDALASYVNRGEISDPPHLVPFLKELSNDERMPLMARNHAAKLAGQLEKVKK